jgi:hypothetical protein
MPKWTALNQKFETEHRAQITIHFYIKAAVEFVARGALLPVV